MNNFEIERFVLDNAVRYEGKAEIGSVVGSLIANHPELKAKIKELMPEINKIVKQVNSMNIKQQEIKLKELGELVRPEKQEKTDKTPVLKDPKDLVVRFAPNPNGPISLGHCRPGLWNWFLAKKYDGKYILRFDDTDPKTKVPMKEAYDWFIEDLAWLGVKPDKVVIQSERLEVYYKYAEELIKLGKAYVCTCDVEVKKKLLQKGIKCDCYDAYQTERWQKMFKGYKEGEAVLRIKTDLKNPNPAVRDWAAFKIVDNNQHPLNKKARVWPLLNFASAIDDHEFKVTHIIRGIDLSISDDRQKYIYRYLGWKYPETMYNGKLLVDGVKSTSMTKALIASGKITGWDDPRLGTIRALKRRGFQPEAIINFIKSVGLTRNDTNVSMDALAAFNKDIIDKTTKRYFLIIKPKKIKIKNAPILDVQVPSHPDNKKLGVREFKTTNEFYIQDKLEKGKAYRFMHLFNFIDKKYDSAEYKKELEAKLIHWLPVSSNLVNVDVLMNNGKLVSGLAEHGVNSLKVNDIVQFERFGFCRLDKKEKDKLLFVYCHD
nr:glutamate--tRNA ligase [Nanoarchaeum sp.]